MPATTEHTPLPRDLAGWLRRLRDAPIPVLADTAELLEHLAQNEEAVDAHALADTVSADPLLTVRLLAHVGLHHRRVTEVETVTGALVLLGIPPFFRAFADLPVVEEQLRDQPRALAGLRAVIVRARRSANFALGIAVHRGDHDAMVIQEAALLHDFAEMLLWCHAPDSAWQVEQRLQSDPTLQPADVQRECLGIELAELQHALMQAWQLPQLLIRLDDDRHAASAPVNNVRLAVRLAHHTAGGWEHPAVEDDVAEIASLLRVAPPAALALLKELET